MNTSYRTLSRGLLLVSALFAASLMPAQGNETITLRAHDSGLSVTGNLKGFDGRRYTVATLLGEMVLEADQVVCEGVACPATDGTTPQAALTLAMGADLAPRLLPLLVESYAAQTGDALVRGLDARGNLSFRLSGDESFSQLSSAPQKPGFAFGAITTGKADLTLTRDVPGAGDLATALANKIGPFDTEESSQIIGLDALTAIVSPSNPVRGLSPAHLADIFSGRIANWAALGGPNAPIHPVMPDPGLNVSARIQERVLAGTRVSASAKFVASAAEVADNVAHDPFAIGLTTFANVRGALPLALELDCGLTIAPNRASILTEAYPFVERIKAYSLRQDEAGFRQDFTRFLASDAAQRAVSDAGYVGQNVSTLSLDGQGQRFISAMLRSNKRGQADVLRELLNEVARADRLTPTFRFLPGGAQLDQKAVADVARLAAFINRHDLSNREILFLGFTDGVGATPRNRKLSKLRAELVKNQIMGQVAAEKREALTTKIIGFGEISPVACDNTNYGQDANRRVEVWIRAKR